MEVTTTNKGKPMVHYLGYAYRKHRENTNGIVSWLCQKQKSKRCTGRLKSNDETVLEVTDHQCGPPDEESLYVKRQICKIIQDDSDASLTSEPVQTPCASSSSRSPMMATPTPANKRRTAGSVSGQNTFLQNASELLDTHQESEAQIPTIAKVWGEKLITLDPLQRILAEKGINDILFEASLGTLHRFSIKINEDGL